MLVINFVDGYPPLFYHVFQILFNAVKLRNVFENFQILRQDFFEKMFYFLYLTITFFINSFAPIFITVK